MLINDCIQFNLITNLETILLKPKLKYIYNPDSFQCLRHNISETENQIQNHTSRSNVSKDSLIEELGAYKEAHKLYGCDPEPYEIDGMIYEQCPCEYVVEEIYELMDLANQLERGNLPYSGGVLEQPGKLYDLINLVVTYRSIYQKK